jgi:hypothetical protein
VKDEKSRDVLTARKKPCKYKLTRPLAVRTGLEPATSCVTGRHSNQLNYRTKLPEVLSTCWTFLKGSAKIALPSISPKFDLIIFQTCPIKKPSDIRASMFLLAS